MTPANDNAGTTETSSSRQSGLSALFAVASSLVVLAAIAAGIFAVGSPAMARLQRLDQTRVQDLQALSQAVQNYYRTEGKLPVAAADLKTNASHLSYRETSDPETGAAYEYLSEGDRDYTICATFALAGSIGYAGIAAVWAHEAGRHCFKQSASKT